MDRNEMSYQFDLLFNNIISNASPGVTNLEKSTFLTNAQESICLGLYTGAIGGTSFEGNESVRRYLDNLVKTVEVITTTDGYVGVSTKSKFYALPKDVWFITYESCLLTGVTPACLNPYEASVIPVTQDEYYKNSDNPYRGPSKDRVLRLDAPADITGKHVVELVSNYPISKYIARYMKRPTPIIIESLINTQDYIWGQQEPSDCILDPSIHMLIVQEAVKQAKIIYETGLNVNN